MGSIATADNTDNRQIVEDLPALQKLTAPDSLMSDPLGLNIKLGEYSAKNSVKVEYGDVTYNAYPAELNELVDMIMTQSASSSQAALESVSATTDTMTDIVEGTKTPLSQYMPYAVLVIIIIIIAKVWKK